MGTGESGQPPTNWPMRCRKESEVPRCFRGVKCPYPEAKTVYGTYGVINYSLDGPKNGEPVICFHGLNGSRTLYQDFAKFLARHGNFRVLSFDLYGHGLSNAPSVDLCPGASWSRCCGKGGLCGRPPRGRYDLDFFVEQTDELVALLGMEAEPLNLVGFCLGGIVSAAFALRFPSRVRRLVMMSPSGFMPSVPKAWYLLEAVWCCIIPLAPKLLCTCWYKRERFTKSMKSESNDLDDEVINNLWSRFVWQLYVKRGVASATLGACHRIPWHYGKPLFQKVGKHPRPVLLVWGDKDTLAPAGTSGEECKACFDNVQLLVVKNAGHVAMADKPRQVYFSILAFLKLPPETRMETARLAVPPGIPAQVGPPRTEPPALGVAPSGGAGPPERPQRGSSCSSIAQQGTGNEYREERVGQMPVPLIFGHMEDLGTGGPAAARTR